MEFAAGLSTTLRGLRWDSSTQRCAEPAQGQMMRKVLLVGINYRGYDERICREIKALGHECESVPFRGKAPNSGYKVAILSQALHWVSSLDRRKECEQFVRGTVADAVRSYDPDTLLLINPIFLLDRKWLQLPQVPVFNWLWDPVWRYPQFREALSIGSRNFSYDASDCKQYGMHELPLFSVSGASSASPTKRDIDFGFIGSLYPERFASLARIIQFCRQHGHTFRFAGDLYYFTKLLLPILKKMFPAVMPAFEVTRFTPEQCVDLYARSRCVVNFHAHGHYGFSMRTFEALSQGSNVLTELQPTGLLAEHFGRQIIVADRPATLTDEKLRRCLQLQAESSNEELGTLTLRARLATLIASMEESRSV